MLTITLAFFLAQKHLRDIQSRLFLIDVLVAILVGVMDIWTCLIIGQGPAWPAWILNMLCLISGHALAPLMLFYFLVVVDAYHGLSRLARALLLFPISAEILLIVTSPLTGLIFHIDEQFQYLHGELYFSLYVVAVFYVVCSLVVVIRYRKRLLASQFYAALSFMVLQMAVAVLQIIFPGYLLVCLAACCSIVMMYFTIQAPGDYLDGKTQAYNRSALDRRCREAFGMGMPFTLLAFAVDNFQQVNTIYGTDVGDELLKRIAAVLQKTWPWGTVARDMGDRFIVMIPRSPASAAEKRELLDAFPRKWTAGAFEIPLTACRIAMDSGDFDNSTDMLATLDYTVLGAKRMGHGSVMIVDAGVRERLRAEVEMEAAVERAIREGRISVWFQPIMDMRTGRIHAAEALSRIYDERLGWISPNEFIPVAERNGSIIRLSEVMRERVCAFISRYDMEGAGIHHISTNLSVIECMQSTMVRRICDVVKKYGLREGIMSLEITESTAAMSKEILRSNMNALIEAGFDFHLDDYGSGYSNIVNLLELPFSTVKIDKLILQSAYGDKESLVERLISPFRGTGISVVCEGIETERQSELVKKWFVEYGQGFLYSKPLPEEDFVKFAGLRERTAQR